MGYETLKNMIAYNREQEELASQEELTECPYDIWPLDENESGQKSCSICGRIYR